MGKPYLGATPDQLRSLADGSMTATLEEAKQAATLLNEIVSKIDTSMLWKSQYCVQFMRVLSAVFDTHSAALNEIQSDIDKYRTHLYDTAKQIYADDESAAARFIAIERRRQGR